MRNRILAGVGVAALATLGLAAPANATAAETFDLYVVHGVPGEADFPVDIYANGAPVAGLQDVTFGTVTGNPLELPAGDYLIEVFPGDANGEGDPALAFPEPASIPAGASLTVVAHLNAEGGPVLTVFENNVDAIAAGEARLTVRHTAAAPAVDVIAGGAALSPFTNVSNPTGADADIPAGAVEAGVALTGTTDIVDGLGPAELPLAAGTNTMVHAIGSAADGNLELAVITISGLGDTPSSSPDTGAAGLVAENNTGALVGGAALLIALLAAAGIIARRATVSSK